jgi:hypothetical protein
VKKLEPLLPKLGPVLSTLRGRVGKTFSARVNGFSITKLYDNCTAEDFAVVKIAGHPAKKPSFWINRSDFVRQYQRIDGFWFPLRDETFVDVKIYGRRVFTVDHQHYVIDPAIHLQAEKGDMGDPD